MSRASSSISTARRPKVAIIGAGAIGLGIGWRLAQAGAAVDVFERASAGRGASWAAAGMLAAGVETEPGERALAALARASLERWPGFAAELESLSGIAVELRTEGTLAVATSADEAAWLRHDVEFQRSLGIELEWLTGVEARRLEPRLSPGIAAAALSPGDHQVNNRQLVVALARAVERAGGRLHEHTRVHGIEIAGGRVRAVRIGDRAHEADFLVLAAGAWSREIEGLPPEAVPPVRPVKGQMLALQMDAAAPLLRHVVWAPGVYLVPAPRRPVDRGCHGRGARLRCGADRGRHPESARGRLARASRDRGLRDSGELGGLPPGLARRRADPRTHRDRGPDPRHRPSPERHPADAGHRGRGEPLRARR